MPLKRKSYSAAYKLKVVKYAVENGNRAAERKFGVSEKLVRDWRKAEVILSAMKKTKKARRGLKARWPVLEERVHRWVLEQRAAGRRLTIKQLRLHALVVAKEMNIDDFAGGPSWCFRFRQRKRLVSSKHNRNLVTKFYVSLLIFFLFCGFVNTKVTSRGTVGQYGPRVNSNKNDEFQR